MLVPALALVCALLVAAPGAHAVGASRADDAFPRGLDAAADARGAAAIAAARSQDAGSGASASPSARRAVRRCSPRGIRALRGTARVERRVRCLLNARRARAGLPRLRYDRCLDRAAERHARDMVRRRYFAHSSVDGRTLAQRASAAGYMRRAGAWRVGENLAWGAGRGAAASAIVHGWMGSPPHRANVLARAFRDVGVAVVEGAPVRRGAARRAPATFVVEFGARRPGRSACLARR